MVAKEDERLSNCLRLQVTNVYAVLGSVHESAEMKLKGTRLVSTVA